MLQVFEKKIKNHTFHGYRCGDPNLPVLVCLHGMTGDAFNFLGLIDFLTKDFQLILIDGPGHGQTLPFQQESDYRLSRLAECYHQFVQEVIANKSYSLLGHSWGAEAALHLAKHFPEKVERLILVDGGYVFPELVEGMTEEKALKGWEEYAHNSHYPSWQDVINIYQDYTTRPWDSILDAIIQSNFRKENEDYLLKADKFSLLSIIKAIYHEPSSTTYHDIQCPVLFFHATVPESDADREKGIARIKKSIKTIKVIGLPHTQHNIHWDCPKKVADEILSWKQEVKEVNHV